MRGCGCGCVTFLCSGWLCELLLVDVVFASVCVGVGWLCKLLCCWLVDDAACVCVCECVVGRLIMLCVWVCVLVV